MHLNPAELKDLEEFASLFFSTPELAILLQQPLSYLKAEMQNPDSPVAAAIQRGRLLQEAKIRKSIIDLATQGSSPAQAIVLKLIQEFKISEAL